MANTTIQVAYGFLTFRASIGLKLSSSAPTAVIGSIEAPGADTLAFTGKAPALLTNNIRTPAAGSAALTGKQPSAERDYLPVVSAGALTLAGKQPSAERDYLPVVSAGALTLAGKQPSAERDYLPVVSVGALVLTGKALTVVTSNIDTPTAGALALTGKQPSAERDYLPVVSVGALTLTGKQPSAERDYLPVVSAGALTLAGKVPIVGGSYFASVPKARTNLLTYSEDASDDAWLKADVVVALADLDVAVAPNGTTTVDRLNVDAGNTEHRISQLVNGAVAGDTYTISDYVKDDGAGFVTLSLAAANEDFFSATFNLADGSVTQTDVGKTGGVISASGVVDVGNDTYRVWVTGNTAASAASGYFYVAVSNTGTFTCNSVGINLYTAVDGEDVLTWGMQCEPGVLTSYVQSNATAGVGPTLVLTGPAPVISMLTIVSSGALSLNNKTPVLQSDELEAPAAGALAVTGTTPTLLFNNPITVPLTRLDLFTFTGLELFGYPPTITANSVRRQPGAGSLALTGQLGPLDFTALERFPLVGSATLVGQAPTLSQQYNPVIPVGNEALTFANQTSIRGHGLLLTGSTPNLNFGEPQPAAGSLTLTNQTVTIVNTSPQPTLIVCTDFPSPNRWLQGKTPVIEQSDDQGPSLTLTSFAPSAYTENATTHPGAG